MSLLFLLDVLKAVTFAAARRIFKGPRHPGWTFRYEMLVAVLRRGTQRLTARPVQHMRDSMARARVHRKVRRVLRHERGDLGGRPAEIFTPLAWSEGGPTVLYLHGGGYIVCSPGTHRDLISRIAAASGARAIAIDYRKAPEHPFPAATDDALAAYRAILEHTDASRVVIAGDSAGGGLTLATLLRAREEGLPTPAGAVLLSPWVDLERTGETIEGNAAFDYLHRGALDVSAEHYLGGGDPRHPHVSAVHADLGGLPPLLIQTGGAEMFLSENRRLAERARSAGVRVIHEIEEGMVHVWHALASFTPEPLAAIERIGGFVRTTAGADASAGAARSAEQSATAPASEATPDAAAARA